MIESDDNATYNTLSHWNTFKFKLIIEGIIVGILTGFIVVLYRYLLEKSLYVIDGLYIVLSQKYWLIPFWIVTLAIIGYIVGLLVKKEPMISGSGIPQVEGVLLRKLHMNWLKVIIGKFVGGVLSIGSGLSLGREGPSVQLGAAVGLGVSRVFNRLKLEEKFLITSGASAGLAAAFNAPLAGAMFSLEETHKNFSPLVLLSALSAALSADFVSSGFFGLEPVFDFKNLTTLTLNYYFYIAILGVLVGILGVVFNKTIMKTQDIYSMQKWLPAEFKPIVPLILSVPLGLLLPQVLGGGHTLIMSLVKNNFHIKILVVLLVVKFLFTMVSYGSGAPGGIFLPLLTVGALIGTLYGTILVTIFHFNSIYISNFVILAMAGYFTAVVRAPITGSILITEMTGSFNHLLPLALISIIAYITADLLKSEPIYESLLDRFLMHNTNNKTIKDDKTKAILEIAVYMGSLLDGKCIKEIEWPNNCLLVAVKRGEKEIIPKGNTLICPGDYLIVLTDNCGASKVTESLLSMANSYESKFKTQ
ncbi:ClC family H(+)/Cl(-) exchange transporter [Clostridium thailandense]|uniref:ClC family H(+)/Cl(-) exchange transporter n=1 Tax=Clostridium thailandense TaxID=2794346 RepID=UPI003988AC69